MTRIQSPTCTVEIERWEINHEGLLLPKAFWDALSVHPVPEKFRRHRVPIGDLPRLFAECCKHHSDRVTKIITTHASNGVFSITILRPPRIQPPLSAKLRQFLNL